MTIRPGSLICCARIGRVSTRLEALLYLTRRLRGALIRPMSK